MWGAFYLEEGGRGGEKGRREGGGGTDWEEELGVERGSG